MLELGKWKQALCTRVDPQMGGEEVTPHQVVIEEPGYDDGDEEEEESSAVRILADTGGFSVRRWRWRWRCLGCCRYLKLPSEAASYIVPHQGGA